MDYESSDIGSHTLNSNLEWHNPLFCPCFRFLRDLHDLFACVKTAPVNIGLRVLRLPGPKIPSPVPANQDTITSKLCVFSCGTGCETPDKMQIWGNAVITSQNYIKTSPSKKAHLIILTSMHY